MSTSPHLRRWQANALMALAGLGAFAAHAETAGLRMDRREDRQVERIHQGMASGELTRNEQVHLAQREERIDRMEGRMKADGKVTGKEAARMERAQDKASHRIALNKHDRQPRP